jgi:succinylglutamate desuccinylase
VTVTLREDVGRADVSARVDDFIDALPGPTILAVRGRDRSRVRAVAGMLHGNEPSGVRAIHRALREGPIPPTDILYFVGAVDAARAAPRFSHRFLPGRRDLNRCFRAPWDGPDGAIARSALAALCARPLEVAVDLHNNTGRNPSYAIGAAADESHLAVSALFTTRFIHSDLKLGSFAEAMGTCCPSVTVECGQANDPEADETAWHGLARLLKLDRLDPAVLTTQPMTVFSLPLRVELSRGATLAFGVAPHPDVDLTLDPDIDRHNFQYLSPGTRIGFVRPGAPWPVVVRDASGVHHARSLFGLDDRGGLVVREALVPIMMTTDPAAAANDCLFYAVQRRESC